MFLFKKKEEETKVEVKKAEELTDDVLETVQGGTGINVNDIVKDDYLVPIGPVTYILKVDRTDDTKIYTLKYLVINDNSKLKVGSCIGVEELSKMTTAVSYAKATVINNEITINQ